MKWSQGLCAAILIDGLYPVSPLARLNPRLRQNFPDVPVKPASTPNALAPDWRLSPPAGRTSVLDMARFGVLKGRPPGCTLES
jgi:hypothetical protein